MEYAHHPGAAATATREFDAVGNPVVRKVSWKGGDGLGTMHLLIFSIERRGSGQASLPPSPWVQ